MIPPTLIYFAYQKNDKKRRFWLPVVVLWPIVIVLSVLLAPLAIVGLLVWKGRYSGQYLMALGRLIKLICSLRGMNMDVQGENQNFEMKIY